MIPPHALLPAQRDIRRGGVLAAAPVHAIAQKEVQKDIQVAHCVINGNKYRTEQPKRLFRPLGFILAAKPKGVCIKKRRNSFSYLSGQLLFV